jgi:CHASE3 domain sensor protein
MKIVSLLKGSIAIIFLLAVVSVASMYGLYHFTTLERQATANQTRFRELGLQLMAASDDLTNWARAYVQYGNKEYFDLYMSEVETVRRRDDAIAGLKALNAPEDELALVSQAGTLSNTLAQLEGTAFEHVMAGDFDTARQLMFGEDYETGKLSFKAL